MQCPRCGYENPQDSQVCSSCSFSLLGSNTEEPKPKAKIGRTAFLASLAGMMAVASAYFFESIYGLIIALLGLAGGVKAISEIRKRQAPLWRKTLAIAIICFSCVLGVLVCYWKIDAAPIADDYTISDLRSAPGEYNHTYDLLNTLGEPDPNTPGAPSIGLSEADIESLSKICSGLKRKDYPEICEALDANAAPIMQLWQNSQKGRAIIDELDTLAEIADLTEPRMDAELVFVENLRSMIQIYRLYVCLQSQQGNGQAALAQLMRIDSVCTKIDKNARSIIAKLVCIAISSINIEAANFIANNPRSPNEPMETLAAYFNSFSEDRLSLINPIIFEHLICRNDLNNMWAGAKGGVKRSALLKLNSTLRLHRNFTDKWLDIEKGLSGDQKSRLAVWPSIYPQLPVCINSEGECPWYYEAYNPIGSMLIGILLPAMDRLFEIRTKVRIHNDLLQIVLNKRLGRPVNLKARAYGEEYIVDVDGKKILSPGPDGKVGTEDDIYLPINPAVLGWDSGVDNE